MPSKKKWIVDKKGFHAVNKHVSSSSSTPPPSTDDEFTSSESSSDDQTNNEKTEYVVEFQEGKWLPGEEGFAFNKKCRLQVKGKYLKKTSRKKVTFDTFVLYNNKEENLYQQVEGFLNDECVAEAEAMLFYGDKYYDALESNPDAKCYYKFKAHNNVCKNDIESELLEMPQIQKEILGKIVIQLVNSEYSSLENISVTLKNSEKKWEDSFTSEKGEVTWESLPLDCYVIEFDIDNNSYSFEVPWKLKGDRKTEIVIF